MQRVLASWSKDFLVKTPRNQHRAKETELSLTSDWRLGVDRLGGAVSKGTQFCEFYRQELRQVLTATIREKPPGAS